MSGALPLDAKKELLDRIRQSTDILGACPAQYITGSLPETAGTNPIPWITATMAGGPAPHTYLPIWYPRLDIRAYGSTGYNAQSLARLIKQWLEPSTRRTAFRMSGSGALVFDVRFETSAPLEFVEAKWHVRLWPVVLSMLEVAAA